MSKNYKVVYYFNDEVTNMSYYMTDDNDEINEMKGGDIFKEGINKHKFRLLHGYENNKDGLRKYKKDFNEQCNELKSISIKTKSKKYFSINYKKYFNHNDAVYHNWKYYIQADIIKMFEPIKRTEFYIMERCYNAGLITLNLDYKEKVTKCFSRDFSSYYSNLLVGMKIPFEEGKTYTLHKKDIEFGKLKYGIYRVQITYTNVQFSNVFNPSTEHHYTSTILNSVYKYKDYFGLKFKLLKADETYDYNALIYEYDQLMDGKMLFGNWLKDMLSVKAKIPKNKLLKHLLSSLWGSLSRKRTIMKTYDQIVEEGLDVSCDNTGQYEILEHYFKDDGKDYYKLRSCLEPYHYGLARIKPFLVARGRNLIATLAMKNIDNVVRLHTDSVCFSEPMDVSHIENLLPEPKSTGNLKWTKVNRPAIRLDD